MIRITEKDITILGRTFALEARGTEIDATFANEIIMEFSGSPPVEFTGRVLLYWIEVSELIIYLWITDRDKQVWLKELNIEKDQLKKPARKPKSRTLTCEHYVRGETVAGLNKEIKRHGYVQVQHSLRNAPSFKITRKRSLYMNGKTLVAIYSDMTYHGFYYITGFAWLENNVFTEAELDKGTRKYLNDIGIFQPEFSPLH